MIGPETVAAAKFAVAASGAALLLVGAWLRRNGRPDSFARLRDSLLLGLGLLGALGWTNFLQLSYEPGFGHPLDTFHYYVGAKYFDELRYTRLYECTTVADSESGLHDRAARRSIRNLTSYRRESATHILADPKRCTRNFTPERWNTFKQDVGWFRERIPEPLWQGLLADHGYYPSPAWGALAGLLIGPEPVREASLAPLLLIDPLLLVVMWIAVWRCFGWRAACVAGIFWGTNQPGDYQWIGGAFLRFGWLSTLVLGICSLRTGRMASAGFLLTIAALLRLFPAFAVLTVGLGAAISLLRRRSLRPSPPQLRFAAGALAAAGIVIPLSVATAGGVRAWPEFAENIRIHANTPFVTNVGFATFLSYDSETNLGHLPQTAPDLEAAWKSAQAENLASRRGLRLGVLAIYVLLLVRAVGRHPEWVAAVLGTGAVVMFATMSNYYYVVLLGFGLLRERGEGTDAALCGLAALTWCIAWSRPWSDQVHAWISLATVVFVVGVTAWMAFDGDGNADTNEPAAVKPPA
ncbi:MAG: hypothetical protein ACE5FL_02515 [Myxococcota bacterium]